MVSKFPTGLFPCLSQWPLGRPSGDWGSLPLEGGVEAAYKRQLDQAPNPAARGRLLRDLLQHAEPLEDIWSRGVPSVVFLVPV